MNTRYPVFANGTKIIPQPNCCFVYSWPLKSFDVFNLESLLFFNEMDGVTSTQEIASRVAANYPETPLDVIVNDVTKLQMCLEEKDYLTIGSNPSSNDDIFEFADRMNEVKVVQADVEITKNCNLRCKYCFNEASKGSPELPLAQWIEILDALYDAGLRVLKISGGEPFLHPDILAILDHVQRKFIVSVNTNGYFIDEAIAHRLSNMHLQSVQVSLDSTTAKTHDFFRGKGTWAKAMRAIDTMHREGVPLRLSTTVTTMNMGELADIGKLADTFGAELSLEHLKKVGNADKLDAQYFVDNPGKPAAYTSKAPARRVLEEMSLTCQAQLGVVGISYRGNIKPCNLTEEYFVAQKAGVVVKFEKNWRYAESPTLANTNTASDKVKELLNSRAIELKDKCIFEY